MNRFPQMSISQLSQTGVRPDIEVPELSYGINPRMPSASAAVEVRYTPEKGRFFVANQDLSPGEEIPEPQEATWQQLQGPDGGICVN